MFGSNTQTNRPLSFRKGGAWILCHSSLFLLFLWIQSKREWERKILLWSLLQSNIFPINVKVVELMTCMNNGIPSKLDKSILSSEYTYKSQVLLIWWSFEYCPMVVLSFINLYFKSCKLETEKKLNFEICWTMALYF